MLVGGSAIVGSAVVGGPRAFGQSKRKITVGTASIVLSYLPLYVAIQKNYFADRNLEIEIVNTQSGPRTRQALAAEQVLVGFGGLSNAPTLTTAGRDTTLIFGLDRRMAWANVLVRKEDFDSGKLRSLQDLSGRSIAITQPLSSDWVSMVELTDSAKLASPPSFQYLGDLASIMGGLKSKRVDASIATIEMVNQAKLDGWGTTLFSITDDASWAKAFGGDIPGVAAFVLSKSLKAENETLKSFVAAMVQANDFIFSNSPSAIIDLVHQSHFSAFERGPLEQAMIIYLAILSRDNMIDQPTYDRILKVFGRGRLFKDEDLAKPGMAYDNAVDMSFVKQARKT